MTSNLKRTLGGMLTLAVVFSAAEARAQKLEKPGAAPSPDASPAAVAPSGPAGFGDAGQLTISAERMFGFAYTHQSYGAAPAATGTTFTLLSNPFGATSSAYGWPRVGFDYFAARSFSLGGSASFYRDSSGGVGTTGFEVIPRLGYATMVGPWLGIWARGGVTYNHASGNSNTLQYLGLTVEGNLAFVVSPHLVVLFGPALDLGLWGTRKSGTSASVSAKLTDIGAYFGLAIPI
jgi:hypothetical protein